MKISVVTISYNQAQFLERTIQSVVRQTHRNFEYIIVDPGSTDGSRAIIDRYSDQFAHILLDPDRGAADGLNKGFAVASGDIYFYLNSDDIIPVDAFSKAVVEFDRRPQVDVICGHAWMIGANDIPLRRVWSDPFDPVAVAYATAIQVQPSTYIRAAAFRRTEGFNSANRTTWDAELLYDLHRTGARIEVWDEFASFYRLHEASFTGTGGHDASTMEFARQRFEGLIGRRWDWRDGLLHKYHWLRRVAGNPRHTLERVIDGPIYGRTG